MTAVATRPRSLARARKAQHPALPAAVERRLLRLSRQLEARSLTLREATTELYVIHLHATAVAAHAACLGMPKNVGDAYVQTATSAALLEVRVDEQASALAIARAERPLGSVLVLPDGTTEGTRPAPVREPLNGKDLW